MNALSAPHVIPAPDLAAPLAVLLLASIHALVESGGRAARNAVTIARSMLCAAALSMVAVLVAGPFQLALARFGGLALCLDCGLFPVSLVLIGSLASLLIAKAAADHEGAAAVKDSIARWNIAVLLTACLMILSGSLATAAGGCAIALAGFLKVHAAIPGAQPVIPSDRMKTMA